MTDARTPTAARILRYWLEDRGPAGWYAGGEAIDEAIRARFLSDWQEAREGAFGHWLTDGEGTLAYLILTDQMPRNMFRGQAAAFASDPLARVAAKMAVARDRDLAIAPPARQFFYLPFEHAENLVDQDRAVALFETRLPDPSGLLHARAHRAVIRRFGRFPTRNAALGRRDTPAEAAWLARGGYGALVRALETGGRPDFPPASGLR